MVFLVSKSIIAISRDDLTASAGCWCIVAAGRQQASVPLTEPARCAGATVGTAERHVQIMEGELPEARRIAEVGAVARNAGARASTRGSHTCCAMHIPARPRAGLEWHDRHHRCLVWVLPPDPVEGLILPRPSHSCGSRCACARPPPLRRIRAAGAAGTALSETRRQLVEVAVARIKVLPRRLPEGGRAPALPS